VSDRPLEARATRDARNHVSDLRGVSRLAVDATVGVVGVVEAMHTSIARIPTTLGGPLVGGAVRGVSSLVYRSIHGVTRVAGVGIDVALAGVAPAFGDVESSQRREAVIAALNGVVGDHLVDTGNPLAIPMRWRRGGKPVEPTRERLAAAFPTPSGKIVVLVHGLCMNDLQWTLREHDYGAALERDLGHTAVYLHYNTGRHVSTNGGAFASMLEALVSGWPVPVEEIAIVGYSMGGLVARSAHHYGTVAGHAWPRRLRTLVFVGTPHHGSALERGGHRLHRLIDRTPFAAPLARLGSVRSAGITDLRHGNLLDEDWDGHDRFAHGADARRPLPLPQDVDSFAIGATTGRSSTDLRSRFLGDGLVPLASALGHHRDPRFHLAFPASHQWVACGTDHVDLLGRTEVYERIRGWMMG
jgi:hypothetical protein